MTEQPLFSGQQKSKKQIKEEAKAQRHKTGDLILEELRLAYQGEDYAMAVGLSPTSFDDKGNPRFLGQKLQRYIGQNKADLALTINISPLENVLIIAEKVLKRPLTAKEQRDIEVARKDYKSISTRADYMMRQKRKQSEVLLLKKFFVFGIDHPNLEDSLTLLDEKGSYDEALIFAKSLDPQFLTTDHLNCLLIKLESDSGTLGEKSKKARELLGQYPSINTDTRSLDIIIGFCQSFDDAKNLFNGFLLKYPEIRVNISTLACIMNLCTNLTQYVRLLDNRLSMYERGLIMKNRASRLLDNFTIFTLNKALYACKDMNQARGLLMKYNNIVQLDTVTLNTLLTFCNNLTEAEDVIKEYPNIGLDKITLHIMISLCDDMAKAESIIEQYQKKGIQIDLSVLGNLMNFAGTEAGKAGIMKKYSNLLEKDKLLVMYLDMKILYHEGNSQKAGKKLLDIAQLDGAHYLNIFPLLYAYSYKIYGKDYRLTKIIHEKPSVHECSQKDLGDFIESLTIKSTDPSYRRISSSAILFEGNMLNAKPINQQARREIYRYNEGED